MNTALVIISAYLLGCFTTGYYLVRLLTGQDIRSLSSGNLGSRNVGRLLGAKGFILTFLGDAGKGALAVGVVQMLGGNHLMQLVALTAVTAGHIWPLQLHFRGGKGFATLAGGLLLLDPLILLLGLLLCAMLYPLIRRTTMTGLIALALTPLIMSVVRVRGNQSFSAADFLLYCLLVLMVLGAHRSNILDYFFRETTNRG
jgi:glycerol-3-phosphate acyltransferase PlsY